jgi:hypothetical protein
VPIVAVIMPREEHDLDQREVRAEQTGQARGARQRLAGRVHLRHVAAVPPEPDEACRIPEEERPDRDPDCHPARAGARAAARRGRGEGRRTRRTISGFDHEFQFSSGT